MIEKTFARRSFLRGSLAAAVGSTVAPMLPGSAWAQAAAGAVSATAATPELATIKIDFDRQLGRIDPNIYGNFTEHLGRCIYGGIYQPGSPLSDISGFRKDVLTAVKGLHIPILRWPGGNFASGYNWKDGVGPRLERPRRWNPAWEAEESNEFGTDDFLLYASTIKAEPYFCVNMGTGTMQDAADWVEYTNATTNTSWANLRRKNGHADPYNVKYWGLGNEVFGEWQAGHKSAREYASEALEYAKLMRWVDPSIKLVACGANNADWDREVLEVLYDTVDYISLHHYGGSLSDEEINDATKLEKELRVLDAVITTVASKSKKKTRVMIAADEWNVWFRTGSKRGEEHKLEEVYNLRDALWVASALNSFQRMANTVKLACLAQLVNVIAPIITNDQGLFLQTIYWPLQLYAEHSGTVSLDALVRSGSFPEFPDSPYLDVSATTDEAGQSLALAVVNRHPTADISAKITLEGLRLPSGAREYVVNGESLNTTNSFEAPKNIGVTEKQVGALDSTFSRTFAAHSITLIRTTA